MIGADAIVKCLEKEGGNNAVRISGSGDLPLL